jgi:hypothetical protein
MRKKVNNNRLLRIRSEVIVAIGVYCSTQKDHMILPNLTLITKEFQIILIRATSIGTS